MTLLRPYRHMRLSRSGMGGISRFDLANLERHRGKFLGWNWAFIGQKKDPAEPGL